MINKMLQKDEEETTGIVIPFKLAPSDKDENWLGALVAGTHFVYRERNDKSFNLFQAGVLHHGERSTMIVVESPTGQVVRFRVDTLRFSRANEHIETLGVTLLDENKEEEENSNDGGNNSV